MLKIGITGGIGSGKSIISKAFALFNVPTYNADKRAKYIIRYDMSVKYKIQELLGKESYLQNGDYNVAYVAERVFADQALLVQLNSIVHPAVQEDARLWFQENEKSTYVIYEAAIMNAAGKDNSLNYVIAVQASEQTRIQRVLNRDLHRRKADVQEIMAKQKSAEDFAAIADFIIKNNDQDLILEQVLALHKQFITL